MNEVPYTPPFELWKTDHGVDGHDAKTWLVARFTTEEKAMVYLSSYGYSFTLGNGRDYYHTDPKLRNTMGAISYSIRPVTITVPTDPLPSNLVTPRSLGMLSDRGFD